MNRNQSPGHPPGRRTEVEGKATVNIPTQRYLHVPHGRLVVRVTMAIILPLACITALFMLEQRRTQGEMGAILTAFFSDEVLHDVQDRGAGREIQIVILREAQNPRERRGPFPQSPLCDPRCSFSQSSQTTRASFFLSNVFPTDIQAELHLSGGAHSFFISRTEVEGSNPIDPQTRFPNSFGFFVVSHAGLNLSKTEAILYVDHFCRGLCGGGGYFLMRKVNGVWHIVDQHVTWIS